MKHLIVTADDYGVFPSINEATLESAKAGKINSISVLANFGGTEKYVGSVENFKLLLNELGNINYEIELGCHLTITSGKPLTGDKMSFACDSNGYFRSYTEMSNFKKQAELNALKEELAAQVEHLQRVDKNAIRHLTNHHNSLTLFPHHFNIYIEVARQFGIPMRSTCVRPEKRQNLYLRFLNYKLKDDIHSIDRSQIISFSDEIEAYFKNNANGIKTTELIDSRHYGPISFLPVRLAEFILIGQKRRKLNDLLESYCGSNEKSLELLLHLAKPKGFGVDRSRDLDYPGVDRGYFDSRVVEFKSIMGYDFVKWPLIEIKGWKDL